MNTISKQAERFVQKEAPVGPRADGHRSPPGPGRPIRAGHRSEAPAGVPRIRRQDPFDVRPWDDDPGDSRTPEGDLRDGCLAGAHKPSYGFGQGTPGRMARPPVGGLLSGAVPRCPGHSRQGRFPDPEEVILSRLGDPYGRPEGAFRALGRTKRGREVLAGHPDGAQEPRASRRSNRGGRRAHRIPRGHQRRVPPNRSPAVHGPHGTELLEVRSVPGPETGSGGPQEDLPFAFRRNRGGCPGFVCGEVGRAVSHDLPILADPVAGGDPLPEIPRGNPQGRVHDERRRVAELLDPEDNPESTILPDDRGGSEARVHGLAKHI